MGKEVKTNAMRILDKNKIPYEILNYLWSTSFKYKNKIG